MGYRGDDDKRCHQPAVLERWTASKLAHARDAESILHVELNVLSPTSRGRGGGSRTGESEILETSTTCKGHTQ